MTSREVAAFVTEECNAESDREPPGASFRVAAPCRPFGGAMCHCVAASGLCSVERGRSPDEGSAACVYLRRVYLRLPASTCVESTCVYLRRVYLFLPASTCVYLCRVYLCLPASCLPASTCVYLRRVYLCLRVATCVCLPATSPMTPYLEGAFMGDAAQVELGRPRAAHADREPLRRRSQSTDERGWID